MNAATRWKLFCAVSPGLEDLLEAELNTIPEAGTVRQISGGCEVQVSPAGVWAVVHRSRLTESARVRIGSFRARTFDELHAGIRKAPWAAWLPRGSTPEVRVACKKSKLWHSGAVEERVQQQVHARLAWKKGTAVERPTDAAARIYVRVDHDTVRLSVDASGDLLHRRGERTAIGKAPMRETLAAAILRAAALSPGATLWDPFCGSGTLLIEAERAAAGGVYARSQGYGFELWPNHDADAYSAWLNDAKTEVGLQLCLYGCDIDSKEIAGAQLNLAGAGITTATLRTCDFKDMADEIPTAATVVSNLPYGRRADVGDIFRRFGRLLAKRRDLDVWLLLGHVSHAEQLRIPKKAVLHLRNGGLRVGLYHRPSAK